MKRALDVNRLMHDLVHEALTGSDVEDLDLSAHHVGRVTLRDGVRGDLHRHHALDHVVAGLAPYLLPALRNT